MNTAEKELWTEFRRLYGPRPAGRGSQAAWEQEWEHFKATATVGARTVGTRRTLPMPSDVIHFPTDLQCDLFDAYKRLQGALSTLAAAIEYRHDASRIKYLERYGESIREDLRAGRSALLKVLDE